MKFDHTKDDYFEALGFTDAEFLEAKRKVQKTLKAFVEAKTEAVKKSEILEVFFKTLKPKTEREIALTMLVYLDLEKSKIEYDFLQVLEGIEKAVKGHAHEENPFSATADKRPSVN